MKLQNISILKPIFYTFITAISIQAQSIYAGAENICEPNLHLDDRDLNGCSNLPVLYPSNDSQTNTALLLSDLGLAEIEPMQIDQNLWDATFGYVPFDAANVSLATKNKIQNQRNELTVKDEIIIIQLL